jgi:polar amino acid transport system permease protein
MAMTYAFDFHSLTRSSDALAAGLMTTLELTAAANAVGLVLGFGVALLVLSRHALLRAPAVAFVEFFRCTPAIVQVIWVFYCVPILFDVYFDAVWMGVLALGLNLAAFNAEAYRAAIQTVPREQIDAGIALGLSPLQRVLHIVLPTAIRTALPVLITNGIGTFQQSALVALVAIQDLMYEIGRASCRERVS